MVLVVPFPVLGPVRRADLIAWKKIKPTEALAIDWLEIQQIRIQNRAVARLRLQASDPYPHYAYRLIANSKPVRFVVAVSNDADEIQRDIAFLAAALADHAKPPATEDLAFLVSHIAQGQRNNMRSSLPALDVPSTDSLAPPQHDEATPTTDSPSVRDRFATLLRRTSASRNLVPPGGVAPHPEVAPVADSPASQSHQQLYPSIAPVSSSSSSPPPSHSNSSSAIPSSALPPLYQSTDQSSFYYPSDRPTPYQPSDQSSFYQPSDRPTPYQSSDQSSFYQPSDRSLPYQPSKQSSFYQPSDQLTAAQLLSWQAPSTSCYDAPLPASHAPGQHRAPTLTVSPSPGNESSVVDYLDTSSPRSDNSSLSFSMGSSSENLTVSDGYEDVAASGFDQQGYMLLGDGAQSSSTTPREAYEKVFQQRLLQRRLSHQSIPEIAIEECYLDEIIGSGAFGKVYRSSWRGADVAVKFIDSEQLSDDDLLSFRREVQMVALLGNHPNVVKLVGACTKPPRLAMVMQFCHLGSVFDYLVKRRTAVAHWQLVRIARDTAAGLLHLLSEGVVHRDVAARNVLLDESLRAYVNDFGLSRTKDLAQTTARTKQTLGPVKWMAPECLMNPGAYSFATDVWSFGVFLFELLARSEPYPELSPQDVFVGIMQQKLKLVPPLDADPVMEQLMNDCLQYDDSRRPCMDDIFRLLDKHYRLEHSKANQL